MNLRLQQTLSESGVASKLRPHQISLYEQLKKILARFPSAVDLSDCGAGKTYVTAACASESGLPTLVVAPKSAESAWERAAKHFGDRFSFVNYESLRYGNTPFGKWEHSDNRRQLYFKCQTCQLEVDLSPGKFIPCYCHPQGIHCLESRSRATKHGRFSFVHEVRNIVFDEVHRCSAIDSLNAEMLVAARRQNIRTTCLSATAANSPLKMRALGYVLDLHNDKTTLLSPKRPNFYSWLARYWCRRAPDIGPGLHWLAGESEQKKIMADIRNQIFPERGIRISLDEIPNFPECSIEAELYTLEKAEKIQAAYSGIRGALARLQDRASLDVGGLKITGLLRARQEIELLKLPVFKELGKDYREKGFSVVFFVNFRETIEQLAKFFPDAGVIDGQTGGRAQVEEAFQSNKIRELIVNCAAGSESLSLHDLYGGFPRGGLVSPHLSAEKMLQTFGRLHREGGKSKSFYRVILADGTIEEKIWKSFKRKAGNIAALNDSDLNPYATD